MAPDGYSRTYTSYTTRRCYCTATVCICPRQGNFYYSAPTVSHQIYEFIDKLDKAVSNSILQLARMAAFGINPLRFRTRASSEPRLTMVYRRKPRNRLMGWPTLNEKRMAWGFR